MALFGGVFKHIEEIHPEDPSWAFNDQIVKWFDNAIAKLQKEKEKKGGCSPDGYEVVTRKFTGIAKYFWDKSQWDELEAWLKRVTDLADIDPSKNLPARCITDFSTWVQSGSYTDSQLFYEIVSNTLSLQKRLLESINAGQKEQIHQHFISLFSVIRNLPGAGFKAETYHHFSKFAADNHFSDLEFISYFELMKLVILSQSKGVALDPFNLNTLTLPDSSPLASQPKVWDLILFMRSAARVSQTEDLKPVQRQLTGLFAPMVGIQHPIQLNGYSIEPNDIVILFLTAADLAIQEDGKKLNIFLHALKSFEDHPMEGITAKLVSKILNTVTPEDPVTHCLRQAILSQARFALGKKDEAERLAFGILPYLLEKNIPLPQADKLLKQFPVLIKNAGEDCLEKQILETDQRVLAGEDGFLETYYHLRNKIPAGGHLGPVLTERLKYLAAEGSENHNKILLYDLYACASAYDFEGIKTILEKAPGASKKIIAKAACHHLCEIFKAQLSGQYVSIEPSTHYTQSFFDNLETSAWLEFLPDPKLSHQFWEKTVLEGPYSFEKQHRGILLQLIKLLLKAACLAPSDPAVLPLTCFVKFCFTRSEWLEILPDLESRVAGFRPQKKLWDVFHLHLSDFYAGQQDFLKALPHLNNIRDEIGETEIRISLLLEQWPADSAARVRDDMAGYQAAGEEDPADDPIVQCLLRYIQPHGGRTVKGLSQAVDFWIHLWPAGIHRLLDTVPSLVMEEQVGRQLYAFLERCHQKGDIDAMPWYFQMACARNQTADGLDGLSLYCKKYDIQPSLLVLDIPEWDRLRHLAGLSLVDARVKKDDEDHGPLLDLCRAAIKDGQPAELVKPRLKKLRNRNRTGPLTQALLALLPLVENLDDLDACLGDLVKSTGADHYSKIRPIANDLLKKSWPGEMTRQFAVYYILLDLLSGKGPWSFKHFTGKITRSKWKSVCADALLRYEEFTGEPGRERGTKGTLYLDLVRLTGEIPSGGQIMARLSSNRESLTESFPIVPPVSEMENQGNSLLVSLFLGTDELVEYWHCRRALLENEEITRSLMHLFESHRSYDDWMSDNASSTAAREIASICASYSDNNTIREKVLEEWGRLEPVLAEFSLSHITALEQLKKAFKAQDPRLVAQTNMILGRILEKEGKKEKVAGFYRKSLMGDPDGLHSIESNLAEWTEDELNTGEALLLRAQISLIKQETDPFQAHMDLWLEKMGWWHQEEDIKPANLPEIFVTALESQAACFVSGKAYLHLQNYPKAFEAFDRALGSDLERMRSWMPSLTRATKVHHRSLELQKISIRLHLGMPSQDADRADPIQKEGLRLLDSFFRNAMDGYEEEILGFMDQAVDIIRDQGLDPTQICGSINEFLANKPDSQALTRLTLKASASFSELPAALSSSISPIHRISPTCREIMVDGIVTLLEERKDSGSGQESYYESVIEAGRGFLKASEFDNAWRLMDEGIQYLVKNQSRDTESLLKDVLQDIYYIDFPSQGTSHLRSYFEILIWLAIGLREEDLLVKNLLKLLSIAPEYPPLNDLPAVYAYALKAFPDSPCLQVLQGEILVKEAERLEGRLPEADETGRKRLEKEQKQHYSEALKHFQANLHSAGQRYADNRFHTRAPLCDFINCLGQMGDTLLVGTRSGLFGIKDHEEMFEYSTDLSVHCMLELNPKAFLMGTSTGLHLLSEGALSPLDLSPLGDHKINCFASSDNTNLWIGTEDGLYRVSGRFQKVDEVHIKSNNLLSKKVNTITGNVNKNSTKGILIGTGSGVFILRPETPLVAEPFLETEQIADRDILSIYQDAAAKIWFGTRKSGLFTYSNGKLIREKHSNLNLLETIFSVQPGDGTDLIMGTATGIKLLSKGKVTDAPDKWKIPTTCFGDNDNLTGSLGHGLIHRTETEEDSEVYCKMLDPFDLDHYFHRSKLLHWIATCLEKTESWIEAIDHFRLMLGQLDKPPTENTIAEPPDTLRVWEIENKALRNRLWNAQEQRVRQLIFLEESSEEAEKYQNAQMLAESNQLYGYPLGVDLSISMYRNALQRIKETHIDAFKIRVQIARCQMEKGLFLAARSTLEKIKDLPQDSNHQMDYYWASGTICQELGRYEEAAVHIARALTFIDPAREPDTARTLEARLKNLQRQSDLIWESPRMIAPQLDLVELLGKGV